MITFWNDHLVSPVFCKIIYDIIPIEYHVPVVFVPHTKNFRCSGRCYFDKIDIYLQGLFYHYYPGEFSLWKELFFTTFHEFGHIAKYSLYSHLDDAYIEDWDVHDYIEGLANDWANQALLRLGENDKRLLQPHRLGAYFDGRIVKFKDALRRAHGVEAYGFVLNEYRKFKSGGQYSAGEVAGLAETYKYSHGKICGKDTRLINKLAFDLAYPYIDHRGYKHQFYAWGDLPEILRRVAIFRATHGLKPPKVKYLEKHKSDATTLSDVQFIYDDDGFVIYIGRN